MKAIFRATIFILLALQIFGSNYQVQAASSASIFYVHGSHSNARDSSSHGSIDRPWKSLEYAFEQLSPGDTLLIREGTYTNDYIKLTEQNSGQADAPITVKAYPDETVVLENGRSIIFHTSWWIIDGLIFDSPQSVPIHLGAHQALGEIGQLCPDCETTTVAAEYITIRNNEFRNGIRTPLHANYANHILIENNYFHHFRPGEPFKNEQGDIVGYEINAVEVRYMSDDVVIRNNRFEDIGSDGVHVGAQSWKSGSDIKNIQIIENEFWINRPYAGVLGNLGENGIDVKKSKNVLISGNVIHGFRPTTPEQDASGALGDGIVIHNGAQDVIIEKNLFYDNTIHLSIAVGSMPSAEGTGRIAVRNNIFKEARSLTKGNNGQGIAIRLAEVYDIDIYHNTFYNNDIYLRGWQITNSSFKNNIIFKGKSRLSSQGVNIESDHNAWSRIKQPIPEQLMGEQDINRQDLGLDEHLRPRRSSPVRNRGQNFEIDEDFEAKPRTDDRPDLGAIEFGGITVKPAIRSIQLGQSTHYSVHFAPSLDLPHPLELNVVNPFPEYLTFEPDATIMNPGETITVIVTDTHPVSDTLTAGLWHQISFVASYSQTVKNVDVARLLVGGTDIYLPIVTKK